MRKQHRLRLSLLAAPAVLALAASFAWAAPSSGIAPCDKAMIGSGSAGWRSESVAAGPVGVRRRPLRQMTQSSNGLVAKMPILVEGRAPETIRVGVPPTLRQRVFLYHGRVIGRDGKPTTLFTEARGYGEVEFELCANQPRTIWPGGIRVKGRAPVWLLVEIPGRGPIPLPLGRPQLYQAA